MDTQAKSETWRLEPFGHDDLRFLDANSMNWRLSARTPAWRPPTDVFETEEAIVVRVEIAGMREEDFSIEMDSRYLLIRGLRPDSAERRAYHQMEIRFGEFSIEIELFTPIVPSQVRANYENGFLRVVLPKTRPYQVIVDEK